MILSDKKSKNLTEFANLVSRLLLIDLDCNIATAGMTGSGKSTFSFHLLKEYGKSRGVPWSMDHTTWSRKELLKWIDGDKSKPPNSKGLRPGQLPEYSGIHVDELFMLFYRRNWYNEDQIDSIGTLNMCRDRHLLIIGNVPNFWDLDSAYTSRIRFYVYVPRRGVAWIFEQDNNPFSVDKWNIALNKKIFQKNRHPYKCPNFIQEIFFPDLSPSEKTAYLTLRNSKRVDAIDIDKDKRERYGKIKGQRDALIHMVYDTHDRLRKASAEKISKLTFKDVADVIDISQEAVRLIYHGDR